MTLRTRDGLVALLTLSACTGPASKEMGPSGGKTTGDTGTIVDSGDSGTASLPPAEPMGRLLIEEVYYAGAVPVEGRDHYFSDQFIRLRNVSAEPVMAGGLLLGDAYGLAGAINPGDTPNGDVDNPEEVWLVNLWQVPGAPEEVLIEPGGCLLIAQDAGGHAPYSEVDLWDADFETVIAERDDTDDAVVPNLEPLLFTGGVDWLVTVFGPTIVVVDALDPDTLDIGRNRVAIPSAAVVDTMEALMDAASGDFKRLPTSVDAGFVYVSGTYTGESVRRVRTADGALQDTDDSTADFAVAAVPEPGCAPLRGERR